ncbi:MAG: diphthine synthase [Thermoplasmatota archaeon]
MALHLIGLGLYDVTDVTVKGLERIRSCDRVVAEFYTARLTGTTHEAMEAFLQKPVELLDREGVELGGKGLVEAAATSDVALLTAGDPLAATTHTDLMVRARAAGVPVHVVHAPSIYSAAPGLLGLQHYKFGRTTTLVRPEENWVPTSPFDAVAENHAAGLHTLVLLDIKADEEVEAPAGASASRSGLEGRPERGYFMRAGEGIDVLLDLAVRTGNEAWFNEESQVGVVARAGSDEATVVTGTARAVRDLDAGPPLHCLVIPGDLQVVEQEAWDSLAVAAP